MSKRNVMQLVLVALVAASLGTSCIFRKSKMTGTYDGEWTPGSDSDEITIENDGHAKLTVECDECGATDEMEAEIVSNSEFEIDESNVIFEDDTGEEFSFDVEGEGTVERRELELELELIGPQGGSGEGTFEGEKE